MIRMLRKVFIITAQFQVPALPEPSFSLYSITQAPAGDECENEHHFGIPAIAVCRLSLIP